MNDDHVALSARIDRTNELLQRMLAEVAKTPSTHAIFVGAGYLYAAAGGWWRARRTVAPSTWTRRA